MIDDIAALREQYLARARIHLRLWGFGLLFISVALVVLFASRVAPLLTFLLIVLWPAGAWTFGARLGTYLAVQDSEDWATGQMRVRVVRRGRYRFPQASALLTVGDEEWSYPRVVRGDGWTPRHDTTIDVAVAKRYSAEPHEIALTECGKSFKLAWLNATRIG